ncbi:MAG TPA: sigma-70 family RNA polymerase sigma factor [Gemmataceae bacterium]|nr:sigma-70 family RNA polymerase sigma factor [Gemmataceae bacterium]
MEFCASPGATQLLAQARQANGEGLGALLELYRDYLGVLARARLGAPLRGVVNPSDLVQQTFLEACRDFGQFEGTSAAQWRAWLRRILAHNLAALAERHVQARKRDVRRQVSLDQRSAAPGDSAAGPGVALASPVSSPSAQAQQHEATAVLADRLARLPAPHREVLRLRNLEGLAFEEVARRMGRTPGAVRVLWVRALDRLRLLLKEEDLL